MNKLLVKVLFIFDVKYPHGRVTPVRCRWEETHEKSKFRYKRCLYYLFVKVWVFSCTEVKLFVVRALNPRRAEEIGESCRRKPEFRRDKISRPKNCPRNLMDLENFLQRGGKENV